MNWYKNLKIVNKIFLNYLAATLVIVAIIFFSASSLNKLAERDKYMYENSVFALERLGLILNQVGNFKVSYRREILLPTYEERKNEVINRKNISKTITDLLTEYETTIVTQKERDIFNKYTEARNRLLESLKKYEQFIIEDKLDEAKIELLENLEKTEIDYSKYLTDLINWNTNNAGLISRENSELAESSIIKNYLIGIFAVLSAITAGYFLAKTITNPISRMVTMIHELHKGHLGHRINISTKDEVGIMSQTLDEFAGDLQNNVVATLNKVSNGETNVEVKEKDAKDEISPALIRLVTTLRELISETKILSQAAIEGKLKTRGNSEKFGGGYKEIVQGINNTLDAFIFPIQEGSEVLQVMATGDFSHRVNGSYKGDLQIIKASINKLGDSVSEILHDVTSAVQATASASNQISSSSEEMAAGAQEQSSQTSEVATAVEDMTKTILNTTRHASEASAAAKSAGVVARHGGKIVEETIYGMNHVAEVFRLSAQKVKTLGENSDQIGEIVRVIDDIADQTNLLALNAAIEAARAGEQGRGFAVVADEVRKLAERTTKATKEIADMIKQIQKDTAEAVDSMNKGTQEVEKGKTAAYKAGDALKEIINGTEVLVDMVNQVAAASEEQSTAAEQITQNIVGINNVTQEASQGILQIAKASEDLSNLTITLQEMVSKFRISYSLSANPSKIQTQN